MKPALSKQKHQPKSRRTLTGLKFGLRLPNDLRTRLDKLQLVLSERAGGAVISLHQTITVVIEHGLTKLEADQL